MRYVAGFVFMLALVTLPLSAGAQAGEESTASEPSAEQPMPSSEAVPEEPAASSWPAPGAEVPDIDILSQRALEHSEIQRAHRGRQGGTSNRSPGAKAGIAVGVIVGLTLVGLGIGAAVAMSNWDFAVTGSGP